MDQNESTKEDMRKEEKQDEDCLWECTACTYRNNIQAFQMKCCICGTGKGTATRKPKMNPELLEVQGMTPALDNISISRLPRKDKARVGEESSKNDRHTKLEVEKTFPCDICGTFFKQKSHMITHRRIHTGEKPFSCDVCGKSFSAKSSLYSHKVTHTGEKPYACDICEKKFASNNSLNKHKSVHTNEKPYSCNKCKIRFSRKGSLSRHEKIHLGKRPYQCNLCGKTFFDKTSLTEHERIHTGEKPYSCNICQKLFHTSSNLAHHNKSSKHLEKYYSNFVDCGKDMKLEDIKEEINDVEDPLSINLTFYNFVEE